MAHTHTAANGGVFTTFTAIITCCTNPPDAPWPNIAAGMLEKLLESCFF